MGSMTQPANQPAGKIECFAMAAAPAGWLKANGAAVSRSAYAALFAAIGTVYGAGDGSTTFNLPDLRGEFIRGWDDGAGRDPGRSFGSWQGESIQAHTHTTEATETAGVASAMLYSPTGDGVGVKTFATSSAGGGDTRPRNYAMLYCIKY